MDLDDDRAYGLLRLERAIRGSGAPQPDTTSAQLERWAETVADHDFRAWIIRVADAVRQIEWTRIQHGKPKGLMEKTRK